MWGKERREAAGKEEDGGTEPRRGKTKKVPFCCQDMGSIQKIAEYSMALSVLFN